MTQPPIPAPPSAAAADAVAPQPPEPSLFLLRVWRRPVAARAVLREVCGSDMRQFMHPVQLARYLDALWAHPIAGDQPPAAAQPPPDAAPR